MHDSCNCFQGKVECILILKVVEKMDQLTFMLVFQRIKSKILKKNKKPVNHEIKRICKDIYNTQL